MKLIAIIFFIGLTIICLCFYTIPSIGNNFIMAEPLFVGFTSLMLSFCWFRKIVFTKLDTFIVLLLLCILLRSLLQYKLNREVVVLFCTYLLYVIIRYIIRKLDESKLKFYLLVYMIASIGIAFLMMCLNSFDKAGNIPFFPNKSIWCILLASQIVFVLPLVNGYNKSLKIFFVLISIVLLFYADGRAGWIGLLTGICTILILNSKSKAARRTILISVCSILVLLFSLFFYKPNSSSGRLLIYKVTATIIENNLLLGVGYGKFKAVYNDYQADYFSEHNIDNKEALLADNTFYAFNDLLQFVTETGIIGLIIMGFIVFFLLQSVTRIIKSTKQSPLHISAIASIAVIITASMFSYPLSVLPVMTQLIICFSIITRIPQKEIGLTINRQLNAVNIGKYVVAVCLFIYCFGLVFYNNRSADAKELSKVGSRSKALEKYKALSTSIYADGQLFYDLAKELNYVNQLDEADSMLKLSKRFFVTNDTYILSASIKDEQTKYSEAEKDYLRAIYMVPNRMMPRYNLMKFYLRNNEREEAIFWGKSIMTMKVKVPSNQTQATQQKVQEILSTLR